MSDTASLKTSAALTTLLEMLEKYSEVSFVGLPAWKNDETKLNEINMNELRNAINALQDSDTLVSNGTFKMLYQLLDEVVGTKVLTEGYTQGVTIEGINDNTSLILSKNGAPEIFNDYENNEAVSPYSHAEGYSTHAGDYSSVSGLEVEQYLENNTNDSTEMDRGTDTSGLKGFAAHSEGAKTCAENDFSHAEGLASKAIGIGSHAEGVAVFEESGITVSAVENNGRTLVVEETNYKNVLTPGDLIRVKGCHVVVEKIYEEFVDVVTDEFTNNSETVITDSPASQSQKVYKIDLKYKLSEVLEENETRKIYIVNFDTTTSAKGRGSHAEGCGSTAVGDYSHAEGIQTIADTLASHSEGRNSQSLGVASHAEGVNTIAKGGASHSEGQETTANGNKSHAEGQATTAEGECAHSEGRETSAYGTNSHTEGEGTVARGDHQHVQGKYNIEDTDNKYAHIIGNGTDTTHRANAHTVDWQGNGWYAGNVDIPEGKDFKVNGTGLLGALNDEITNRRNADDLVRSDLTGTDQDGKDTITIHGARKYAKSYTDDEITKLLNNWINDGDQDNIINKVQEIITWFTNHSEGSTTLADILNTISNLQTNKLDTENAVGQFERNQETDEILGEKFNDYDNNVATGQFSHAEGNSTQSNNYASHSEGVGTIASGYAQHVEGQYNEEDKSHTYAHIVGNGSANSRSNAHTVDWEGNAWYRGQVYVGGNSQNSAQRLPVIYSGTSVPDNGLGLDGDLYIMFTETTTEE